MFQSRRLRAVALLAAGVLAGAAAGIGGAAAASSGSGTTPSSSSPSANPPWPPGPPFQVLAKRLAHLGARLDHIRNEIRTIGIDGPPVHQDLVVPSTTGGFETVTVDSGTIKSVSGSSLTIDEGYSGKSYRTVTLTIPAGANVDRNLAAASLSDLKAGDRVSVARSPHGTNVTAFDGRRVPFRALALRHGPGVLPAPRLWFVP
jgi:hypothetical protein